MAGDRMWPGPILLEIESSSHEPFVRFWRHWYCGVSGRMDKGISSLQSTRLILVVLEGQPCRWDLLVRMKFSTNSSRVSRARIWRCARCQPGTSDAMSWQASEGRGHERGTCTEGKAWPGQGEVSRIITASILHFKVHTTYCIRLLMSTGA